MATLRPASTQIQMQLEPYGHLIRSTWYYDPAYPYEVTAVLGVDGGRYETWRIGRDLLAEGLETPAGIGDVRVWPDGHRLKLALLDADEGKWAVLSMLRSSMRVFLAVTFGTVPPGQEYVDWDRVIRQLTAREAL